MPGTTTLAEADPSEVAPGVHCFGTELVNWYVVEDEGDLLVVDAGYPDHWDQLVDGLDALGHDLDDVEALVLTHAHPDHLGFAQRLREAADVPVFVHEADSGLATGSDDVSPAEILLNVWRPSVVRLALELVRSGGTSVPPVSETEPLEGGEQLDLPGDPKVYHVPGHSAGSCALHLADREILLCGDALATRDVKRGGGEGPQLMTMFNADRDRAAASLERLESLGDVTLLPGHGDPWQGTAAEAVSIARQ